MIKNTKNYKQNMGLIAHYHFCHTPCTFCSLSACVVGHRYALQKQLNRDAFNYKNPLLCKKRSRLFSMLFAEAGITMSPGSLFQLPITLLKKSKFSNITCKSLLEKSVRMEKGRADSCGSKEPCMKWRCILVTPDKYD